MVIPNALDTSLAEKEFTEAAEQAVYDQREMEKRIAEADAEYESLG